eukprot:TRINITY_DN12133_c0_g1_i1.p1 TRINITY_DN12133_c0_g1~~TRINITY_DN12133_c0_g1_i1.p1  ORF type:complete len:291 (+),score=59.60 TRINITY_DN12133_c0_g1_i1:31-903(+)
MSNGYTQRKMARMRKEYLYRKSLEGKERQEYEKKRLVKKALDEGKPMPTEINDDALTLEQALSFEDVRTFVPSDMIDSEYAKGGQYTPKIMLTSSRNPSSSLVRFVKEMKLVFPGAERMNRGGHKVSELVKACRANGYSDLMIIHETRGVPDAIVISHMPYGPTAYFSLLNVVMRHEVEELPHMSTQNPHLIFDGFQTTLGERVTMIWKYLFPAPKEESKRVITFSNTDDFISFRHHTYKEGKQVELSEIGPRFEMRLFKIILGTIEMREAEVEYVQRSFTNTAKRKNFL